MLTVLAAGRRPAVAAAEGALNTLFTNRRRHFSFTWKRLRIDDFLAAIKIGKVDNTEFIY